MPLEPLALKISHHLEQLGVVLSVQRLLDGDAKGTLDCLNDVLDDCLVGAGLDAELKCLKAIV